LRERIVTVRHERTAGEGEDAMFVAYLVVILAGLISGVGLLALIWVVNHLDRTGDVKSH
jgi:hypothetical protein